MKDLRKVSNLEILGKFKKKIGTFVKKKLTETEKPSDLKFYFVKFVSNLWIQKKYI